MRPTLLFPPSGGYGLQKEYDLNVVLSRCTVVKQLYILLRTLIERCMDASVSVLRREEIALYMNLCTIWPTFCSAQKANTKLVSRQAGLSWTCLLQGSYA